MTNIFQRSRIFAEHCSIKSDSLPPLLAGRFRSLAGTGCLPVLEAMLVISPRTLLVVMATVFALPSSLSSRQRQRALYCDLKHGPKKSFSDGMGDAFIAYAG